MSLLRAITGGVVARFLANHSDARTEGVSKMADEKFEARIKDLRANRTLGTISLSLIRSGLRLNCRRISDPE
jgi:hypothetical protein